MLEKLEAIINAANATYAVEYEEAAMFNVRADAFEKGHKFVYIEVFIVTGKQIGRAHV